MIAVKSVEVRDNFKSFYDRVFQGETIIVSRKKNENIVMLSEKEYNALQKAKHNEEYLAMIDKSLSEAKTGNIIIKSIDELEKMEEWQIPYLHLLHGFNTRIGRGKIKKIVAKINSLIRDIHRNGLSEGIGKPEPLKYRKAWSRRIDHEHRLVYNMDTNGNIVIIACKGHYEEWKGLSEMMVLFYV